MKKVRVKTGPIPAGSDPVHLLVPVPPDTTEQTFIGLETSIARRSNEIVAANGTQRALVFDVPASGEAEFLFSFTSPNSDRIRPEHFARVESRYTVASAELAERAAQLVAGCATETEKLRKLVEFTGAIFDYDHPERPFNYGMSRIPLLMKLTKGSCTDIHGFLVSMMYATGMPAAYYAGQFFAEGTNQSPGFHCWVGTLPENELTYWDIAQQIKAGRTTFEAGFNPIGGSRYAFACGRGLIFQLGEIEALLGHFGTPTWVFADGTSNAYGAKGEVLEPAFVA
jgi:transglutaminase superfamily protein